MLSYKCSKQLLFILNPKWSVKLWNYLLKLIANILDNLFLIFSINVLIISIAEICIWFNTMVHEWELTAVLSGVQSVHRSLWIVWEIISIFLSQWGMENYFCHSSKWYFHYFKLAFRLILSELRWIFGTSMKNVQIFYYFSISFMNIKKFILLFNANFFLFFLLNFFLTPIFNHYNISIIFIKKGTSNLTL